MVDPGDATPVIAALKSRNLSLDGILITHHHSDHVDGVQQLLECYPATVYASAGENYAFPHRAVREGDRIAFPQLNLDLMVMETPGHTLGHVVYYGANSLFCGDTLFGCGCGRLFTGTCEQLYHSLQRLAALPPETRVYCTHEYTQHNIRFALTLEPDNPTLQVRAAETDRLRSKNLPTLPSTIALELETNPFLRCHTPALQTALEQHNPISAFCTARTLRNSF